MKYVVSIIILLASLALTAGFASTNLDYSATHVASAENEDANPLFAQSGWVTFKKIEEKDGFKIFRRYAYTSEGFQNIMLYKCSREPRKIYSHLTVVLPKYFVRLSDLENEAKKKSSIRMLVDEKNPILLNSVHISNEIFIDSHDKNSDDFRSILNSDSLKLFTSLNENPLYLIFTEKVDSLFSEAAKELDFFKDFVKKYGKMKHFNRFEMEEECRKYQLNGK